MSEMLRSDVINSVGLALDIGGVILLFIYGLPEPISKTGATNLIVETQNNEDVEKWKRYKKKSYLGLALLVLGFSLQLVSNWL